MKSSQYIKSSLLSFALYTLASVSVVAATAPMAQAETLAQTLNAPAAQTEQIKTSGDFVRKSKRLKGSYEVITENGQTLIRFADNFKTVNGPDLKVFLSPHTIKNAKGSNATDGAVLLGFVKSNTGTQDYILPEGVNIAQFNSILLHCEAYSVLWGGGNI